jgi:hypothetical protein
MLGGNVLLLRPADCSNRQWIVHGLIVDSDPGKELMAKDLPAHPPLQK